MCGIAAALVPATPACTAGTDTAAALPPGLSALAALLQRRGPTCSGAACVATACMRRSIHFHGHVLHLRGAAGPTAQPLQSSSAGLVFNGQLYAAGFPLPADASDTRALGAALDACTSTAGVLALLASLRGPWAVVWWSARLQTLFFARDVLGRRSLCLSVAGDDELVVASLAGDSDAGRTWCEVPAAGVYALSTEEPSHELRLYPWQTCAGEENRNNTQIEEHIDGLRAALRDPWRLDIAQEPRLFSPLPPVSLMGDADGGLSFAAAQAEFGQLLAQAVARRCAQFSAGNAAVDGGHAQPPATAVLFSGGVDSTVLALLAHRALPPEQPLDLLNVAFENTRRQDYSPERAYDVPDRRAGLAALRDLRRLAPERQWQFVCINVTQAELERERSHIHRLLRPLRTELDASLGCATWFAARGQGGLLPPAADEPSTGDPTYTSTAPVLLLGSGADEQLGGYSRHRVAFARGGVEGLGREIAMDVGRLPWRNLGRDDRIVADLGKDGRYPFLDEEVVSFLSQLPLGLKMDLALPRGVGEKRLLRELARSLGLVSCVALPKRAMQFGSRIAKMTTSKSKATDTFGEEE